VGYKSPPAEHQFKPGQSGNPGGPPKNAGQSFQQHLNALAEVTEAELIIISGNADAPAVKRMAAKQLLDALSDERLESGMPIRGQAADRICDRTYGKPTQAVQVDHTTGGKPIKAFVDVEDGDD